MKTFGKGDIARYGCGSNNAKTRSFFKRQLHRWGRRQESDLEVEALAEAIALVAERTNNVGTTNATSVCRKSAPKVIPFEEVFPCKPATVFLMSDYAAKQSMKTRTVVVIRRSPGHKATREVLQVAA